jgi:hypothetical protein
MCCQPAPRKEPWEIGLIHHPKGRGNRMEARKTEDRVLGAKLMPNEAGVWCDADASYPSGLESA